MSRARRLLSWCYPDRGSPSSAPAVRAAQIAALHAALKANPTLSLTILVDFLRSTRETPKPSSGSLCASLCAAFPDRVDLRLYHTHKLSGWLKKVVPRRFDEGWGLQHMKCYGFDDAVIMSGSVCPAAGVASQRERTASLTTPS